MPHLSPIDLAKGYIRFFEPDVFVEATSGLAAQLGLADEKLDFAHSRIASLDDYFTADPQIPFGLDCRDVYQLIYEREFKFASVRERRVLLFDPATALTDVAFGGFPKEGKLAGFEASFCNAFGATGTAPTAAAWSEIIASRVGVPYSFGNESLEVSFKSMITLPPTVFVVDPDSPLDLIDYWNLRQSRPSVLPPIPLEWLSEVNGMLAQLAERPESAARFAITPIIQIARSLIGSDPRLVLHRAQESLSMAKTTGESDLQDSPLRLHYDRFWIPGFSEGTIHRTQPASLSGPVQRLNLEIGDDLSCIFDNLAPPFIDDFGRTRVARWVNVLSVDFVHGKGETLALFFPPSIDQAVLRRMKMGRPFLVTREGFALPQSFKHDQELLHFMSGRDALIGWFKQHGIQASPSDAGLTAEAVLASVGGFSGTCVLADANTLRTLDDMATSERRCAPIDQWNDLVKARSQSTSPISLQRLVDSHVFRLGLELQCPNCRRKNWFGIGEFSVELTCELCLKRFPFPQGTLKFDRTPWHYRAIGPFSVRDYARGSYSTVLALDFFARRFDTGIGGASVCYASGLNLVYDDKFKQEIDFALWYKWHQPFGRQHDPVTVFGEAKSFGNRAFKDADIERMKWLGNRIVGTTAVFASLKDELSIGEKQKIKTLAEWGNGLSADGKPRMPVIVLTALELFAQSGIVQEWSRYSKRHAECANEVATGDLTGLANATQKIYLNM